MGRTGRMNMDRLAHTFHAPWNTRERGIAPKDAFSKRYNRLEIFGALGWSDQGSSEEFDMD